MEDVFEEYLKKCIILRFKIWNNKSRKRTTYEKPSPKFAAAVQFYILTYSLAPTKLAAFRRLKW